MRLDKFISNNTQYSRSDVRKLIKAKRVCVNGEDAESPDDKVKSSRDIVTIDGEKVKPIGNVYLMLNKPEGVVCANTDGEHPTVIDLLQQDESFVGKKVSTLPIKDLQIAGRLDIDTTGLVLITNDGKWNHTITSPNHACKKTYHVSLKNPLAPQVPEMFAKGIHLEGEKKKTRPAILHVITAKKVTLSISEGKYHQVKRMFAATGNKVKALHRHSIGGLVLDEALAPGQYRHLTEKEVAALAQNVTKQPI
ncbi:pseudouridine synthase [Agarilytica rhodophyticola]|uniref:pseudouridine synthase n=1 Tax=Agarilytica rhodophyticola TaxID=1737490 RepID=UPI000B34778A|nr:pseudouridine synthase [Agarilytica rhodophyticola]